MDSGSTTDGRRLECDKAFSLGEGEGLGYYSRALRVTCPDMHYERKTLGWGEVTPTEPIEHTVFTGRWPRDYIGTTLGLNLLSDRFFEVLTENGFTGWSTYPVRITLKDGSELGGYSGLAVTGRSGPLDDDLGEEVIDAPKSPEGRPVRKLRGACFDPESWDGSDLFTPRGTLIVAMTEEVKDVLVAANLTNIEFKRLSERMRSWPEGREHHLPLE